MITKGDIIIYEIGTFCKPLADQLKGYGFDPKTIEHLQQDADAMTRLVVRGYVTSAQKKAMQMKFHKKMLAAFNGVKS